MKQSFGKTKKGRILIIGGVVIALAAGLVIFIAATSSTNGGVSSEPSFDTVTTGDISLSVSGSGNLGSAQTLNITSDGYLEINDVLVKEGDTVSADQPLATLDLAAMETYAEELKAEIAAQQISIDTNGNVTTSFNIKSPADGWIKDVLLGSDDDIEAAMDAQGYVALIATEKRMIISAEGSNLSEGEEVKVKCEGTTYSGIVTNENGGLYVSIDSIKPSVGAQATVLSKDGDELFSADIKLAAYIPVESSYGTVSSVKFSENAAIETGDVIYKASQYSLSVKNMYTSLAQLKSDYETLMGHMEAGQILSPSAGVVSSVSISSGQSVEKNTVLVSLESTDDWIATVSVDELDINSVQIGQSVNVELDSLPSEVFEGAVIAISDKGVASGGITTYNVDISVENNDKFKLTMTLSCEIMAEEAKDAVLAPIDAVRTTGSASYVMVKTERTQAQMSDIQKLIDNKDYDGLAEYMGEDAETIGLKILPDLSELLYAQVRAVETGIENAYYVQIISGLSAGDSVIITQSSSNSNSMGMFGMQMGGIMESRDMGQGNREMPSGGRPGGN